MPSPKGQRRAPYFAAATSGAKSWRPVAKGIWGPPAASMATWPTSTLRSAMESQGKRLCVSATNARAFSSPAFSGSSRSACDAIVLPLLPPVMLAASNVPEQCQAKRMSRGARLPSSCFRSRRRLAMSSLTPRRSRDAGLETPAAAIAVNGKTHRRCPLAQMLRARRGGRVCSTWRLPDHWRDSDCGVPKKKHLRGKNRQT